MNCAKPKGDMHMKCMRLLLIQFVLLVLGLAGYCIATEVGFEAEDADEIVPIMEIYEDKKASGGMYISAGKGGGGRHPGKADFVINVRTPGQYTMWGRVIAQSTAKDSFHVTVNQKKSPQPGDANMIWDTGQHQEWTWSKVKWREKNPLTFDLKPGKHTVTFWSREGDTRLDAVYMAIDPNAVPKLPNEIEGFAVHPRNRLTTAWAELKKR